MENKNFKVDGNDFSKEEVFTVKTEQNFNDESCGKEKINKETEINFTV
jgi:hypothetical protein